MTRIDSHVHVWRAAVGPTPSVQTLVPPQTDVPIEGLRAVMAANRVERAVLVQPVFCGEDNAYVAACARAEPDRFAAVCVVDPRIAGAADRLAHWVEQGCRGLRLRPRLADEEAVFGDPATFSLWEAAGRFGVVVSVLCGPSHLQRLATLAERFPNVPIVIDHLGHPDVAAGIDDPRFRELLVLARFPSVFVKLSGFYHFAGSEFPYADCWPLVTGLYETFGPRQLLWGSDYPHVGVACGYARALELPAAALNDWSVADRERVMGGNARRLYWPAR
jgi:predicted TIM-barrel fold metal-dependent hydrolase